MSGVVGKILRDIEVELGEEFDKNFERQSFFGEKWAARKSPVRKDRNILTDTGALRRSIQTRYTENSITFFSDLPYAAIQNEGGEVEITPKMKKFFWAKHYEAAGSLGRKKSGELRRDKRNARLSEEAESWKWLALKKVGDVIRIPRRQFLGNTPKVESRVRDIVEKNVSDYFNIEIK